MSKQYPVYCGWCDKKTDDTSIVENSTGICDKCAEKMRKEIEES